MRPSRRPGDRWSGAALVTFVAAQLLYLIFNAGMSSAPSVNAPLAEWRAVLSTHASILRWSSVVPLALFTGLFVPGGFGLRRRLARFPTGPGLLPDLVIAGTLLITMSVFVAVITYAVMGSIPPDRLPDAMLRGVLIANDFDIFGVGGFAIALFQGAASLSILRTAPSPRWLGWWGAATAALSALAACFVVAGGFDGPLHPLALIARASFLAWTLAAGVWLLRTAPPRRAARTADGVSRA